MTALAALLDGQQPPARLSLLAAYLYGRGEPDCAAELLALANAVDEMDRSARIAAEIVARVSSKRPALRSAS